MINLNVEIVNLLDEKVKKTLSENINNFEIQKDLNEKTFLILNFSRYS